MAKLRLLLSTLGNGTRRIERQRAQHRLDFPLEVLLASHACLSFSPAFRRNEHHTVLGELRHEHVVQDLILLLDEVRGAHANRFQLVGDGQAVRTALQRARLQELLQARDSNLEELVEIGARNAQELDPFEQGNAAVLRLFQHALIEFQERQLAIDVELRRL
jgi:hypothetical protein